MIPPLVIKRTLGWLDLTSRRIAGKRCTRRRSHHPRQGHTAASFANEHALSLGCRLAGHPDDTDLLFVYRICSVFLDVV